MEIGKRIKELRKSKGITQKELAKKLNKSERLIQKYESGDTNPPLPMIHEIANILDIEVSTLLKELVEIEDKKDFDKSREDKFYEVLKQSESSLLDIIKSINEKDFQQPLNEMLIHGVIKETMEFISFSLYKKHKSAKILDEKIKKDGYLESIKVMDDKVYKYKNYFPLEEGE